MMGDGISNRLDVMSSRMDMMKGEMRHEMGEAICRELFVVWQEVRKCVHDVCGKVKESKARLTGNMGNIRAEVEGLRQVVEGLTVGKKINEKNRQRKMLMQ